MFDLDDFLIKLVQNILGDSSIEYVKWIEKVDDGWIFTCLERDIRNNKYERNIHISNNFKATYI